MKSLKPLVLLLSGSLLLVFLNNCTGGKGKKSEIQERKAANFFIGWASEDITPNKPVLVYGQFHARVSEGVMDPITVTALAMESGTGLSSGKVILISCDLLQIEDGSRSGSTDNLRDNVRSLVTRSIPELRPEQIVISATHTHTAPYCGLETDSKGIYGIELDVMAPSDCKKYISERIAKAAVSSWKNRLPGGISYGLGHAVVGINRLVVDLSGKSVMGGRTNSPGFSHMEGYEDHSVNLLYTWDNNNKLTGIVVNIACPSQESEGKFLISADFWHDTKLEIGQRLGKDIHVLPQCSAAGDQEPHLLLGTKAEERMQKLMFGDSIPTGRGSIGRRKQIAVSIADAVTSVLPCMKDVIDWDPVFDHRMEKVELSRRLVSREDVDRALKEAGEMKKKYEQLLLEIKENPVIKEKPRWYTGITSTYTRMKRGYSVKERYELQKVQPKMPFEIHILRIGDVAMATNPFELYLDYGIRMKGRSPAVQTFVVQLTGEGSYLPAERSLAGGSYGAVPASTLVGPEGGQELVEKTLEIINTLWQNK